AARRRAAAPHRQEVAFRSHFVILCETHFISSNRQMPTVLTKAASAAAATARELPRYRNQAAQRVLAVLSCFAGPERDLGVTELALRLGLNKNMVHCALTMLAAHGFVTRAADRSRYQLGWRVLTLAGDDEAFDIRALARPALEELHALTGESVFLSIIVGGARVNVDWIEARGRRVSASQPRP